MSRALAIAFGAALVGAAFVSSTLAAPAAQSSPTVQVATSATLGPILVNAQGMTLYILTSEAGGNIQCTGACLQAWPPLLLPAGTTSPTVGTGVTGTIATITRPEGTQVTYNGYPLYTYAGDTAPGQTNGEGVPLGSGTWHAAKVTAAAATPTPTSTGTTAPSGPLVQVANDPTLGPILVNAQGMTLYYNTAEHGTTFVCTGGCLAHWPTLSLPAGMTTPTAAAGVTGTLGVVTRPDGSQQVTYNNEPLYTFAGDTAAGQTKGNGIKAFGGIWYAAQVNNTPVPLAAVLAVPLMVHITTTGSTVWGAVTVRYALAGRALSQTCSLGSCRMAVPAGVTVHLSQKPANARTWSFAGWTVRSGQKIRAGSGAAISLRITRATRVTARYSRSHR